MKRNTAILLTLVLALPCLAIAATDTAVAFASYTVAETVELDLDWLNTFNETQDFGTVPAGTIAADTLNVRINHNLGATTSWQLSISVNKTLGPVTAHDVNVTDGSDSLIWGEGGWGVVNTFSTTHQGEYTIDVPLDCQFVTYSQFTAAADYAFEITITTTSL